MKRLQVQLSTDAWSAVESLSRDVQSDFNYGSVTYSDLINEMILSAKVDVKAFQGKIMELKRTLRVLLSKKDLDIETTFEVLNVLKSKSQKRSAKQAPIQKELV